MYLFIYLCIYLFIYLFMGDSVASSVQYGAKSKICKHVANLPASPSDKQLIDSWANFTLTTYGAAWPLSSWYDSEKMKQPEGGSSARSWYYIR